MPSITPSWTDTATNIVAIASLARNAVVSGTIDLRSKFGAFLFICVGKTGTTALTNGVEVRVNRTINNNGRGHPSSHAALGPGAFAAAQSTTVNADSASGQNILNVASTTSWAQGDYLLIVETGGGFTRAEWARVARVTDATHLLLDRNLQFTHTAAQADTVRNKADIYSPVWCPGGSVYEVIFDYGDDAAGDSVIVECTAQTYDSDAVA